MGIWRSLNGTVTLQITTADPAQLLSELHRLDVPMEQVRFMDELTLQLRIKRQYLKFIQALAKKQGAEGKVIERSGLYWNFKGLMKRPILIIGLAIILVLTLFLPTRLLFFRVDGNISVPARQIIALAGENGLEFGTVRRDVRSEKVKNALLKAIPELEWVGINTSGCVATISVRERQSQAEHPTQYGVSSIIAIRDGIVQELTVTAGSASVQPGQKVAEGQVLISGYTDCGLSVRAERAKGEVYATTNYQLTIILPENNAMTGSISTEKRNFSLIFGKNRINFSESSGILDTGCVKMYEESYVTLPGGFELPLGFATERCIHYTLTQNNTSQDNILLRAAERYLQEQMIAGTIVSREEVISRDNGQWRLEGSYVCLEMIGIEQSEEIITP